MLLPSSPVRSFPCKILESVVDFLLVCFWCACPCVWHRWHQTPALRGALQALVLSAGTGLPLRSCPCRCCCGCPKTSTEEPDRVVLIHQGPPVYYVPPVVHQQPGYR
jgi:hypothetical protein